MKVQIRFTLLSLKLSYERAIAEQKHEKVKMVHNLLGKQII
jgi:hypothetical protein